MARSRIAARLARKWRADPQAPARAIIKVLADVDEAQAFLEQRGLVIVRRYSLLPTLAVSGTAHNLLSLAGEEWIASIEEDVQVHTTKPSTS